MAEAIVPIVLEQLTDIIQKQIHEEVRLVRGVQEEILHLSSELKTIQNVLEDAEMRGYKENNIQNWLKKLEDTSYDIIDVLDEWNYAKLKLQIEGSKMKVCPFIPSSCLSFEKVTIRHDIAKKIKGLKEKIYNIVNEKVRYDFIVSQPVEHRELDRRTTSLVEVMKIQGRGDDKDVVVSKLIHEGAGQQKRRAHHVISIVGVGGIGKTTLAQLVYDDGRVKNCFTKMIWICVSDVSDEVKIAKGIVEQVNGSPPNHNELESLLKCLADSISGEKFLLVLDNVVEEYLYKWRPLENSLKRGGRGSKVLITTRSERVAKWVFGTLNEIHHLNKLSDEECWLLMPRIAFFGRMEEECGRLPNIGRMIAEKCKGLPLAAKVLGSHLAYKDTVEKWENVLNSKIWDLEEVEVELFPHLFLSYNELSPAIKYCFSYCAVFPKGTEIVVDNLIRMWMAVGYLGSDGSTGDLERRGRRYFDKLKMCSYFQDFKKNGNFETCKMHDIVHDFAQFLRMNKSRVEGTTKELSQAYDQSLVSQIKVYRSLICEDMLPFSHVIESLRVLKVRKWGEIETEIENLIHLRYLDLNECTWLGQIPQAMLKLYNLETLYLDWCELKEIPKEIGNLIHLRHLSLSYNKALEELPETICNLHLLRTLDLTWCSSLETLPEEIYRLINLRHLPNGNTIRLIKFPQGLEQLDGLRTLNQYNVGIGRSKLGYLNKLNRLSGDLKLNIHVSDTEDVIEAQKAELIKKSIKSLELWFYDSMEIIDGAESLENEVMEALQPPSSLQILRINYYKGTRFPRWITSPLIYIEVLEIKDCEYCQDLPPLGKLPFLEELSIGLMKRLQFLEREFLGITSSEDINTLLPTPSSRVVIGFPRLKELTIYSCHKWKEWEDITLEEDESASIMPYLRKLSIISCDNLTVLPHRLLRKASLIEHLVISSSPHLSERYKDKEGSNWKSLSHIPHIKVDGQEL